MTLIELIKMLSIGLIFFGLFDVLIMKEAQKNTNEPPQAPRARSKGNK